MKKINLINIILILILVFFSMYIFNEEEKNIKTYSKEITDNFNKIKNKYLIEENKRLTALLNIELANLNVIAVRGYFINLYDEFVITKGESSGLKEGDIVINDKRLIGFIRNINKNYANVELLKNTTRKISVKIGNNYGFLKLKDNKLIITGINSKDMKRNDPVYTSGLTAIPGNIYIGNVDKIIEKDETFETEAFVEIIDDYKNLKYLLVVKNDSNITTN